MKRFVIIACAIALVAPITFAQDDPPPPPATVFLGDRAPEIDAIFVKGGPLRLADAIGKNVIVVEFWATWCGPCKFSIPHLSELQAKYRSKGLVVIGVSDESTRDVEPFVNRMGSEMEYRVAVDSGQRTLKPYFRKFGMNEAIPEAFVIDVNGRVAWHGHPMNPFMEELIQVLLEDIPRKTAPVEDSVEPEDAPGE